MTRQQRVRFEMFLRVRDFGLAHREMFPESSTGGQAFAKVADAVERIKTFSTSKLLTVSDGHEDQAVARAAVIDRMRIVARTARGLRKSVRAAGRRFVMPKRVSYVALLAAARSFLEEAGECRAQLDELGIPQACLPELRQAVEDLETALAARRAGRAQTAASQAGIRTALRDGASAIRTLDIVVLNAIEGDAMLAARWIRDRRVITGAVKASAEPAPAEVPATPPIEPPQEVLPKAS